MNRITTADIEKIKICEISLFHHVEVEVNVKKKKKNQKMLQT